MKIVNIELIRLHNEELFQLMADFKGLAEENGVSTLNIEQLFAVFVTLFERVDIAVAAIRKNAHTKAISNVDSLRDDLAYGFTMLVKAYLYRVDEAMIAAAERLLIIINTYGDFRRKPYNEETAIIYNFLQDIEARCAADVALLGAQGWIDDLRKYNREFEQLMSVRFDDKAAEEYINMREARREIEANYKEIIERIDALMIVNGEAPYAEFIKKWNIRVEYYKTTLAQRAGRNKAAKEKEKGQ